MSQVVDLPEYVGELPNICGSEEILSTNSSEIGLRLSREQRDRLRLD